MASPRHHDGGYIDHRTTIGVVLVLGVVAGSRVWPLLPSIWSRFLLVTAAVTVVGGAVVAASGAWAEGRALRAPVRTDGGAVVRIPRPARWTAGVILWVLAIDFLAHAWLGDGLAWWVVAALGVVAGVVGTFLMAWRERLVVEPDRVALETTLFGRRTHATERVRERPGPPEMDVTSHTTGGAFGQPLMETHALRVDGEVLYEGTRSRAEALRDAIVGASAPAAALAILLRLDAEPPYREAWKTRPPGWDDPAGDGVCAALGRSGGFRGLTVFELGTGKVQWLRDPERARDLGGPLGSELFERLDPLEEDEVGALGNEGIRAIADAFLRSRGFAP